MVTQSTIDEFVSQPTLALVGASRNRKKLGSHALRALKTRRHVLVVHPSAATLEGEPCYPSLVQLPEQASGVIVVVKPAQAEAVVREAYAAGIKRVWLQPGAESADAVRFCETHGMTCISGQCILMFAAPKRFPQSMYRRALGLLGRLPK